VTSFSSKSSVISPLAFSNAFILKKLAPATKVTADQVRP